MTPRTNQKQSEAWGDLICFWRTGQRCRRWRSFTHVRKCSLLIIRNDQHRIVEIHRTLEDKLDGTLHACRRQRFGFDDSHRNRSVRTAVVRYAHTSGLSTTSQMRQAGSTFWVNRFWNLPFFSSIAEHADRVTALGEYHLFIIA
jgi:hypothetical protein